MDRTVGMYSVSSPPLVAAVGGIEHLTGLGAVTPHVEREASESAMKRPFRVPISSSASGIYHLSGELRPIADGCYGPAATISPWTGPVPRSSHESTCHEINSSQGALRNQLR